MQWRKDWCVNGTSNRCVGSDLYCRTLKGFGWAVGTLTSPLPAASPCRREGAAASFAPVAPPEHPTYDVYAAIDAALAEDAGDYGDISTLST